MAGIPASGRPLDGRRGAAALRPAGPQPRVLRRPRHAPGRPARPGDPALPGRPGVLAAGAPDRPPLGTQIARAGHGCRGGRAGRGFRARRRQAGGRLEPRLVVRRRGDRRRAVREHVPPRRDDPAVRHAAVPGGGRGAGVVSRAAGDPAPAVGRRGRPRPPADRRPGPAAAGRRRRLRSVAADLAPGPRRRRRPRPVPQLRRAGRRSHLVPQRERRERLDGIGPARHPHRKLPAPRTVADGGSPSREPVHPPGTALRPARRGTADRPVPRDALPAGTRRYAGRVRPRADRPRDRLPARGAA